MSTIARRGAVAALLMLSAACESLTPTSPPRTGQQPLTPPPAPPPAPPTQPPTTFPPQSGPSRTFIFDHELVPPASQWTRESRFVLYDNGAFALRHASSGNELRGGYTETNGVISFAWELGPSNFGKDCSKPASQCSELWGATGIIQGNTLTVRYNFMMQESFDDAAYVLMP